MQVCIAPYKASDRSCPSCNDEDYATLLNKQLKRRVAELPARCYNEGCSWIGELNTLNQHLEKCEYTLKHCRHSGCGRTFTQRELGEHERHECSRRPLDLQLESFKVKFTERLQLMEERYDGEIKLLNRRLIDQEKLHREELDRLRQEMVKSIGNSKQRQGIV